MSLQPYSVPILRSVNGNKISGIQILQLKRRSLRHDLSTVKNDDIVRIRRLFHVMRGKENGHLFILSQITDHTPERISRLRI